MIVKIDLLLRDHLASDIIFDEVWGILYFLLLCSCFCFRSLLGLLLGLSSHFRLRFWCVFSHIYFYKGETKDAYLAISHLEGILEVPHKS